MSGILVQQAEVFQLKLLVNFDGATSNLTLRLFSNNHFPTNADTEADYTECAITGYAAISLPGASWTVTPDDPSYVEFAEQTFTFTGSPSGDVYGYYLTRNSDNKLMVAQRFNDAPEAIANPGDQVKVSLYIELSS